MSLARAARMAGRMTGRLALLLGLAACGQFGDPLEAIGARVPPPDEFQVMTHEPPVIPQTYSLPEPRLGAPSPRAPDSERAAIAALLGPEAAARAAASSPSPGEQVLLSSANAASASSDIRVQLEEEKRQAEADKPYEPPLLWDLLGLTRKNGEAAVDETEVIDPAVESERLQAQGVATPVDPDAAARAEEENKPRPEPEPIDRLPRNRIGPPPQPAF
ncbi:MAG TPA: DUF3035 domain-containing protein [Thermohalobaculum sp.]|nr:DUF3035 domain-containing protein [Thermohalobaculum sp.]